MIIVRSLACSLKHGFQPNKAGGIAEGGAWF